MLVIGLLQTVSVAYCWDVPATGSIYASKMLFKSHLK